MHSEFLYNLGLKKNAHIKILKKLSKEKMILVGNSGDPSNNHIDIYESIGVTSRVNLKL